jgi:DNA-binding protein YbaB
MIGGIDQIWSTVADIEETVTTRDGHIRVTVDARGTVRSLTLHPRVYRDHDATALAARIVEAATMAAELARERTFSALKPLLPANASLERTDLVFDPILHHLEG